MFIAADKPISKDPNYIGVPKKLKGFDYQDVKERLDAVLVEMEKDGTIELIRKSYAQ